MCRGLSHIHSVNKCRLKIVIKGTHEIGDIQKRAVELHRALHKRTVSPCGKAVKCIDRVFVVLNHYRSRIDESNNAGSFLCISSSYTMHIGGACTSIVALSDTSVARVEMSPIGRLARGIGSAAE